MGLFSSSKSTNPADAAMPYYDKIPGMEKGYYDPFINRGSRAGDVIENQYGQESMDPVAFLENLMKGYEPSRGYQLQRDEALKAAGNTAAAGGMRGSQGDIYNTAKISDLLMGEDMQSWLKNILGIQEHGLSGESHLFDTGYNASSNLASDLSNVYGTQGQLAFQGQREQNQRHNDLLSALIGGAATIGGSIFGGPIGGAIGGSIGKGISKFI